MTWLTVAIGGTLGALTRYALGAAVATRTFPWTTLVINISGAFMLAFLIAGPFAGRRSSPVAVGTTVGFLGAYTTFSTFGLETVELLRDDRLGAAFIYVAASLVLGLLATAFGYWLGQQSV
ncbi:MAG TPA: fluoride efflux transporter CrcB [Acidimicrobiales bacterium]|nr:fluoride efflux transporter CrcB [Acidimicrobiales bacterium]